MMYDACNILYAIYDMLYGTPDESMGGTVKGWQDYKAEQEG